MVLMWPRVARLRWAGSKRGSRQRPSYSSILTTFMANGRRVCTSMSTSTFHPDTEYSSLARSFCPLTLTLRLCLSLPRPAYVSGVSRLLPSKAARRSPSSHPHLTTHCTIWLKRASICSRLNLLMLLARHWGVSGPCFFLVCR